MNVSRKALEERERRALRLAEESFSHVNQKVSWMSVGCIVFVGCHIDLTSVDAEC